ncbi:MAG: VOC family protein [Ilumatobacteraceae bacterium]
MSSNLVALAFDSRDPSSMARFWAEALGWRVGDTVGDDGVVSVVPTDHTRFVIEFAPVEDPKVGQNRNHLDLTTTSLEDQRDSVARLLELGGRHIDIGQSPDEDHVVLADPEGNEFCILAPGNNFLAGCERLGAINCDGTRRVGQFWSEVLGWPLVWDQDEETAIRAPDGTGPLITWSGPPLMDKRTKNRLHLDIAPPLAEHQHDELERLIAVGARRVDVGQGEVPWVVLADPDDNEFCLVTPRDPRVG